MLSSTSSRTLCLSLSLYIYIYVYRAICGMYIYVYIYVECIEPYIHSAMCFGTFCPWGTGCTILSLATWGAESLGKPIKLGCLHHESPTIRCVHSGPCFCNYGLGYIPWYLGTWTLLGMSCKSLKRSRNLEDQPNHKIRAICCAMVLILNIQITSKMGP